MPFVFVVLLWMVDATSHPEQVDFWVFARVEAWFVIVSIFLLAIADVAATLIFYYAFKWFIEAIFKNFLFVCPCYCCAARCPKVCPISGTEPNNPHKLLCC